MEGSNSKRGYLTARRKSHAGKLGTISETLAAYRFYILWDMDAFERTIFKRIITYLGQTFGQNNRSNLGITESICADFCNPFGNFHRSRCENSQNRRLFRIIQNIILHDERFISRFYGNLCRASLFRPIINEKIASYRRNTGRNCKAFHCNTVYKYAVPKLQVLGSCIKDNFFESLLSFKRIILYTCHTTGNRNAFERRPRSQSDSESGLPDGFKAIG